LSRGSFRLSIGPNGATTIAFSASSIPTLLTIFYNFRQQFGIDRPVLDGTNLTGLYDFNLRFNAEGIAPLAGVVTAAGPDRGATNPSDFPSLTTALQEQLGLKLESTKGPVDVLVIESVQRPSEN
jgi:uncharacterized protein (TIGR03435 family)